MIRLISAAVLLSSLVVAPVKASANDRDVAKALFRQGANSFRAGDYTGALRQYKRAYRRFPSPKILLSKAACLVQLRRYARAARVYQRYLDTADDRGRKGKVRVALAAVKKMVGVVHVELGGPRVRVTIDGRRVAANTAPVRVPVDPGPHSVVVKRGSVLVADVTVRVVAGKEHFVPLRRAAMRVRTDVQQDAPSTPRPGVSGVVKWATGVGVVALAVGIKFGVDASRISDELSSHSGPWTSDVLARQQEGRSAQNTMWLFTGIGAAALVTGGVMYLLSRPAAKKHQSVDVALTGSPTSLALGVSGRF